MEFPTIKNNKITVVKDFIHGDHILIIEIRGKREYNKFMNKIGDLTSSQFNMRIGNYKNNGRSMVLNFNQTTDLIDVYNYFDLTYNRSE
jgi:hypothetical protein